MSQPYGQDPYGYQQPQYPPQHGYGPPPPHRKRKSSAPLILVVIGVVLLVGFGGCAVLIAAVGNGTEPTTNAQAEPAEAESGSEAGGSAKKTKERVARTAGIGDTVKDGKFAFTVTKMDKQARVGGDVIGTEAQGVFLLVHVTVENIGDEAQAFSSTAQKLHANGKEFDADAGASIYLDDSRSLYEKINPGNKVRGIVLFDVPENMKPGTIELHDSLFSDGVMVSLAG